MAEKISIIVPIYNMEKYIDRCISSLINQSYQNLEILLIDDGSTDCSAEICKRYVEKDERIRYYYKENGGQCTARNFGIDVSTGNYIAFVDSDDYVEIEMYEKLLQDLRNYDSDIACCSSSSNDNADGSDVLSTFENDEIMKQHICNVSGLGQSPCDKLFKKELFDDVRFAEMRAYEDCATIYKVLSKCKKAVYRDLQLYHYIQRENSTMTQKFSKVKFLQVEAYYEMYLFYNEQYPQYVGQVKELLVGSSVYCVGEAYKSKRYEKYKSEIQVVKAKLKTIGNKGLSKKRKFYKFLVINFPKLLGMIYKKVK